MRPHRKPGFHQAWLGFPILRHVLYPIAARARAAYCWVHGVYRNTSRAYLSGNSDVARS